MEGEWHTVLLSERKIANKTPKNALEDFTDDVLTISAGNLFSSNWSEADILPPLKKGEQTHIVLLNRRQLDS